MAISGDFHMAKRKLRQRELADGGYSGAAVKVRRLPEGVGVWLVRSSASKDHVADAVIQSTDLTARRDFIESE